MSGLIFSDLTGHMKFVPLFLMGALLAKSDVFRARLVAIKTRLWMAALGLFAISLWLHVSFVGSGATDGTPTLMFIAQGFYGGVMLYGAMAFAAWALNKPSRGLTYATDAILPVYLMHQTVLVVVADAIVFRGLPAGVEVMVLLAATTLIPLAVYQLFIRHTVWLRVLFGLRPRAREASARQPQDDVQETRPAHP